MRVKRLIKRIVLGLLAFVVVAVAGLLIFIHTNAGRNVIRGQINAKLDDIFLGGGSVGEVTGSPFTELQLHDVVINGPDGKPAISAKTVKIGVGILPLVSKKAMLKSLVIEDANIVLKRDQDGQLQINTLLRPAPSSGFSVDIPTVELHRGHFAIDTGTEWVNIDGLEIFGAAHMPYGKPLKANLSLRGLWRERAVAVGADGVVVVDQNLIRMPSLIVTAGMATVAAANVSVTLPVQPTPWTEQMIPPAPVVGGTVIVNASAMAVAQLLPGTQLPADISLALNIAPGDPWSLVTVLGQFGLTPVRALVQVDIDKEHARGLLATGLLDLTKLTAGKVAGNGGGLVVFDVMPGADGKLPTAQGIVTIHGDLVEFPTAQAAIAFDVAGDNIRTVVGAVGRDVRASIAAEVERAGQALTLKHARVIASSTNPAAASGGKAPLHGSLNVNLAASGALLPQPNLAVAGKVIGTKLAMQDVSIGKVTIAVDARQLPRQPIGRAEVLATDIVRQQIDIAELKLTAANRADGKIQVSARTKPKQEPWLIELDALVTPPGNGSTVAIDLQHHHVRAGKGGDWQGDGGRVEIGPRKISVKDFSSKNASSALALAGQLDRLTGDFAAKVDATHVTLEQFQAGVTGTVDAHVDVARTRGQIAGTAEVTGKGLSKGPLPQGVNPQTLDFDAKVTSAPGSLQVAANAQATGVGAVRLDVDVQAPKDITNAYAWKRLDRRVIRTAKITADKIDLAKVASILGVKDQITAGTLDGDIELSADATGGTLHFRNLVLPALHEQPATGGAGGVNADLAFSQSGVDELTPTLTAQIENIGKIEAAAKIDVPYHMFDPLAWKQLGPKALKEASVRVQNVAVDPGVLSRFGITSNLRGQVSVAAELTDGMSRVQLAVDVKDLRGDPIAQPIDGHFAAAVDGDGANTTIAIRSGKIALLDVTGKVPVTLDQLRTNPKLAMQTPLDITATIPSAPAPKLLAIFGRSEVTSGTLGGTIKVGGTLGKPTATAHLVGTKLALPPGPRNTPIKVLDSMTIDGTWDGAVAKVTVDGVESKGKLHAEGTIDPANLGASTLAIQAKEFDLGPVLVFAPGPAGGAAGRLDADLKVTGLDINTARILGQLHLRNARMPIAPEVGTMHRTNVDIVINETTMTIDVAGRLGGGDVTLKSKFLMQGTLPTSGELTLALRKVSPIGAIQPEVTADVTGKLSRDGVKWTADLFVKNGNVKIPSTKGEALKPVGAPKDMVFVDGTQITKRPMEHAPPVSPSIVVNVTLYSTYVVSDEIHGLIKGKLTLSADADAVGIVGSINADRADLDLFGRRYQVEQAAVRFDGTTDPLLDIRIVHDFSDVTTITTVRGRLSKPELVMSSDPGLYTQGQLLGFLLGGEPGGDPESARDQATGAGASFVANQLGGYVKKALPFDVDVLRYEAASASSGSAVLVGKWVSRSLFVAFRQHLDARVDENMSEGEAEYWVSRRVSVEATAGDRGYDGVDLLWRKRY